MPKQCARCSGTAMKALNRANCGSLMTIPRGAWFRASSIGSCRRRLRFELSRRRMAERQGEIHGRPAAGSVESRDLPAVRVDDGTADREAQADARRGRFTMTTGKFLEHRILTAGRQPWAIVGN